MEPEIKPKKDYSIAVSIVLSAVILSGAWVYGEGLKASRQNETVALAGADLENAVVSAGGVVLPIRWGDLGLRMVKSGVIDRQKFESVYSERGGLSAEEKKLLDSADNGNLTINNENAGLLLNLLWALGLGNKNPILENGPISDPRYGGAGGFASTGGWTIAQGEAMNHFSGHPFMVLTSDQQEAVERVSKGIYRPCCNNATHFPDCNHGMAMLGLLELMASQGKSEQEMYQIALKVNSYWFPDTYLAIAQYLEQKGIAWNTADPKQILGGNFSSISGYQEILKSVNSAPSRSSGGCGVDAGAQSPVAPAPRSSSGCGV
ncbi:MAG: hypothetical protein Q8P76_04370 [bacterium]|nr:hypothetical protein [bacterium]